MIRSLAGAVCASMLVATSAFAASPDATNAPASVASADKIRCKRYTETGTLAKVHKECHTQAEWQELALKGRETARAMLSRTVNSQQQPQ